MTPLHFKFSYNYQMLAFQLTKCVNVVNKKRAPEALIFKVIVRYSSMPTLNVTQAVGKAACRDKLETSVFSPHIGTFQETQLANQT